MRKIAILGIILLCAGCGKTHHDSYFVISGETNGVWLSYNCANPFALTLLAEGDSRRFPNQHQSGKGKIRIFQDKGAIWLSEDGQGYGSFTSVTPASLLPAEEMRQTNPNLFPVGVFCPKGTNTLFVYLRIDEEKPNQ